jgi:hypothetical protein
MAITYTEKGYGLHNAIRAAGHHLEQLDGIWTSSDDSAVQIIIDAYTLDAAKAEVTKKVSAHAKVLRDRVVSEISMGELASWPVKLAEAVRFAETGNGANCPMLSAEAQARGIPLAALVGKVGGNALGFSAIEAAIGGADGKHRDAIKAITTFVALADYDCTAGWPEV